MTHGGRQDYDSRYGNRDAYPRDFDRKRTWDGDTHSVDGFNLNIDNNNNNHKQGKFYEGDGKRSFLQKRIAGSWDRGSNSGTDANYENSWSDHNKGGHRNVHGSNLSPYVNHETNNGDNQNSGSRHHYNDQSSGVVVNMTVSQSEHADNTHAVHGAHIHTQAPENAQRQKYTDYTQAQAQDEHTWRQGVQATANTNYNSNYNNKYNNNNYNNNNYNNNNYNNNNYNNNNYNNVAAQGGFAANAAQGMSFANTAASGWMAGEGAKGTAANRHVQSMCGCVPLCMYVCMYVGMYVCMND
jgi:hypothetical protein